MGAPAFPPPKLPCTDPGAPPRRTSRRICICAIEPPLPPPKPAARILRAGAPSVQGQAPGDGGYRPAIANKPPPPGPTVGPPVAPSCQASASHRRVIWFPTPTARRWGCRGGDQRTAKLQPADSRRDLINFHYTHPTLHGHTTTSTPKPTVTARQLPNGNATHEFG